MCWFISAGIRYHRADEIDNFFFNDRSNIYPVVMGRGVKAIVVRPMIIWSGFNPEHKQGGHAIRYESTFDIYISMKGVPEFLLNYLVIFHSL